MSLSGVTNAFMVSDEPPVVQESEDESAEEGEFVPSSWDMSLQPKRSSLKSPEKEQKPEEVRREQFASPAVG
jgi:hypothetical protein